MSIAQKRWFPKSSLRQREMIDAYVCLSPWLIGLVVFTLGPFLFSFGISFFRWNMIRPPTFVGIANFAELLRDDFFWYATKATFYYTVLAVPTNLIGGLVVALFMNLKLRGISIYRTLFYSPAVVSGVATAMLWLWMFDTDLGLINQMLQLIGIRGPSWLGDKHWAIPSLVLVNLWSVGGGMLILLGALQNVPTTLYEAATIDGAGMWVRFRHITLPMISPILFFNLVTGFIGAMQVFTNAFVITAGGPAYSTMFYVLFLYNTAFKDFRMGYASALGWLLFVIIMLFTVLILRSSPAWVYYEGLRVGEGRDR
jgi:multiple sugar transport system permease protein